MTPSHRFSAAWRSGADMEVIGMLKKLLSVGSYHVLFPWERGIGSQRTGLRSGQHRKRKMN